MLEKHLVQAFLQLAESGSFQEAAKRLSVSNASFSRYIVQVESRTGMMLFHRHRYASKLTRAGQEFLPIARRLMSDFDQFERRLENLQSTGGGTLRIGCGPLTTQTLIKPVIQDVLTQLPDLRISVEVSAQSAPLEQLQNGQIDVFVGDLTYTPDTDNIEIMVVAKQPVIFVCHPSHPIHQFHRPTLGDVFSYPFASPHLHKHWRASLIRGLGGDDQAMEKVNALPQLECDDYGLLKSLLDTPDFIVGGMRAAFENQIQSGKIKVVPTRTPLFWNICAARKQHEPSEALRAFWAGLEALNEKFATDG